MKKALIITVCITLFTSSTLYSQNKNIAYVDKNGVMRWGKTKVEIHAFGVNYTLPFAYAYRNAVKMGLNPEKLVDDDVYQFARLGFDLFRVHVWDCEISDSVGNVLVNEHLRLFDYMIKKMKERGMKFMITPIAYWGNGWPERDEKTPGFSSKYGKDKCLTDPAAIKAQQNYLFQFLNHVNSYTGLAYKDDDDVIGFEICNEPHHREPIDTVKTFINGMVASMRKTGCRKPILYNISHSIQSGEAYFNSDIQGGTFQWYPTGLGSQHELGGNLLVNVDKYDIPYKTNPKFSKEAKIVYEFDAADVGRSYIYPAMARSFREAGMQLATHFAYDPTYSAYANTEYGTHYMNLIYAPQKALSLKIAGEVFNNMPMYKNYGGYPNDTVFGPFHVSYVNDLAEMISDEKFIYTNNTISAPAHPEKLQEIAGYGNSPMVRYEGTGAYFLDKIKDGMWRLEVLPDAIWVNDPFGKNSLKKEVAVVNAREWPIRIDIPDLGKEFLLTEVKEEIRIEKKEAASSYNVHPGIYILSRKGTSFADDEEVYQYKNIQTPERVRIPALVNKTYVLHQPLQEISAGTDLVINVTIVSPDEPSSVELYIQTPGNWFEAIKMQRTNGYHYSVTIPSVKVKEGYIQYYITINQKDHFTTYPGAVDGHAWEWDFTGKDIYRVPVVKATEPVILFNAATDANELSRQWLRSSSVIPLSEPGKADLLINIEKLFSEDGENKNGEKIYDYSMHYHFGKKTAGRRQDIISSKKLVVKGYALNDKPCTVEVALITKNGTAFGGLITLDSRKQDHELMISSLKKVKLVTLPRPYPSFLPYYFINTSDEPLNLDEIESIQISVGPGIPASQLNDKHGLAIERIWLE